MVICVSVAISQCVSISVYFESVLPVCCCALFTLVVCMRAHASDHAHCLISICMRPRFVIHLRPLSFVIYTRRPRFLLLFVSIVFCCLHVTSTVSCKWNQEPLDSVRLRQPPRYPWRKQTRLQTLVASLTFGKADPFVTKQPRIQFASASGTDERSTLFCLPHKQLAPGSGKASMA